MIQRHAVSGTTLTVSGRARHHTTVRAIAVVAQVTVARSITTVTVVLVVVVAVITTTRFTTRALTESSCSTGVTTIATSILCSNHSVQATHTLVAVTEVLVVVVGFAVVGTLVNQTSPTARTDVTRATRPG